MSNMIDHELVQETEVEGLNVKISCKSFDETLKHDEGMEDYLLVYIGLQDGMVAKRIAQSSSGLHDLPVTVPVPDGLTYGNTRPGKGSAAGGDYWIGYNYKMTDGMESRSLVLRHVEQLVKDLKEVSLEDAARKKLTREPEWFVEGMEEILCE